MGVLRVLLALVLPTCLLVLAAPAPPAAACSCVGGDARDFAGWADTIFTGTLTEIVPPPERPLMSGSDPASYRFDVDTVYEGEAHETTAVRSLLSGASCGLEGMETGASYVVFATHEDMFGEPTEPLWANLCGGTSPASSEYVAKVEAVTGPGSPPLPGESVSGPPPGGVVEQLLLLAGAAAASALTPLAIGLGGLAGLFLDPRR